MNGSAVVQTEKVGQFRGASLWKDTTEDGHWSYRLMKGDHLICRDRQRKYLNEIMYQVGEGFINVLE